MWWSRLDLNQRPRDYESLILRRKNKYLCCFCVMFELCHNVPSRAWRRIIPAAWLHAGSCLFPVDSARLSSSFPCLLYSIGHPFRERPPDVAPGIARLPVPALDRMHASLAESVGYRPPHNAPCGRELVNRRSAAPPKPVQGASHLLFQ